MALPSTVAPTGAVPPATAIVSFRLGGTDGVAVEAEKWAAALRRLGSRVVTVAGTGADRLVPGLAIDAGAPPSPADLAAALAAALADVNLVVVENLLSLPLNPGAGRALAAVLAGRRCVLRHHDLAWQRPQLGSIAGFPPHDPAWVHVTINELSRRQLAARGIPATVVRNVFSTDRPSGDREATRAALGVPPHERLLLQPTRAIARKNVAGALALASAIGATYWLLGPAEEGYGPELDRLLRSAPGRTVFGPLAGMRAADAYAAADAVALPSTWEGFGNPTIESALCRRPLAVGDYPVARELAAYGFRWFPADDPSPLQAFLDDPDPGLLDHNEELARPLVSPERLPGELLELFGRAGWSSW